MDEKDDEAQVVGPFSVDILPFDDEQMKNMTDKDLVEFYRNENAILREQLLDLEEQLVVERSTKKPLEAMEMERIDFLLQKAEEAKEEAKSFSANTSKDKLRKDVNMLQNILKKAKAERHSFRRKIKAAEQQVQTERSKMEKEEVRFQVDREIFARIIKEDREQYRYEVNLLVQKMTELQKDKHDLYLWAKEQQERHLQEIRKLTRALSKTKKMVDDQTARGISVLQQAHQVHNVTTGGNKQSKETARSDELVVPKASATAGSSVATPGTHRIAVSSRPATEKAGKQPSTTQKEALDQLRPPEKVSK